MFLEASCVRPPGVEEPQRRAEVKQGRRQAREDGRANGSVDDGEMRGRSFQARTEMRTLPRCGSADRAGDAGEGDRGRSREHRPPAAAREERAGRPSGTELCHQEGLSLTDWVKVGWLKVG